MSSGYQQQTDEGGIELTDISTDEANQNFEGTFRGGNHGKYQGIQSTEQETSRGTAVDFNPDETSKYEIDGDDYDGEDESEEDSDEESKKQGDETRLEIEEVQMEYDRQLKEMYNNQRNLVLMKEKAEKDRKGTGKDFK